MKIFLPNSAHLQNIEGFLRKIDTQNPEILEFSMHPSYAHAHPAALAFIASLCGHASENNAVFKGKVLKVRTLPYFVRMGLFNYLKLNPGKSVTEHEAAGRFIPLTQIKTKGELSKFITDIIPLLHKPGQDGIRETEPIEYVISELVRNVLEHSASRQGAIVCAQYYSATKRLALGVSDAGIGIYQSLSKFHQPKDHLDAIMMALKPGVTGTTARIGGTSYNAGAGLFFTKSIACASKNYFIAYSGNAMFKLKKTPSKNSPIINANPTLDKSSLVKDLPNWQGTVIGIDISLSDNKSFSDLLNSIKNAYRIDVKNRQKSKYKKPRFI